MANLEWNTFTKKIHINAPLEKIYWCWATTEGITSWFLKDAIYNRSGKQINKDENINAGDTYLWKWYNWDGQEEGKILKANSIDTIKFTFANNCTVSVTLEQKETAVLVSLEQKDIPEDDQSKLEIFYGCSNGWTFWLANLKAYLEHGILLNEKDIDLRGFDLSGYEFVNK